MPTLGCLVPACPTALGLIALSAAGDHDAAHPSAPGWIEPPETDTAFSERCAAAPRRSWLGPYERIGSASVEYLTSPGLQALRDLVNEVADRRRDLEREIAQLRTEIRWLRQLERICRLLLLRLLTFPLARSAERKRIAAEAARAELEEILAVTRFELDFAIDDVVVREFGGLNGLISGCGARRKSGM